MIKTEEKTLWKNLNFLAIKNIIVSIFFVMIFATSTANAVWWNSDFNYQKEIILNNPGLELIDYQINITMDTESIIASGKMRTDCGDIRFANMTDELPYWIESGCNRQDTKIWIKVPSVPAGSSTIFAYFGNSSILSASNGSNVFVFYDDFNGSGLDTNKWQGDTAYFSVVNGELKGTSTPYRLQSNATFSAPVTQEVKARTVSVAPNGAQVAGFFLSTSNSFGLLQHSGTDYYRNDGSWPSIGKVIPEGNIPFKIIIKASSQVNYSIERLDNGQVTTGIVANSVSNERIALGKRYDDSNYGQTYETYWDSILIRKYSSVEPTTYPGLIEASSGVPIIDNIRIYPNSPSVSDSVFISSGVADPNIQWINYTLISSDGTTVLNNLIGSQNGNTWNSSAVTADKSGRWHYTIMAKDADGNTDTVSGSFIVKSIINGDWYISGNTVKTDEEIILNGNLIIPLDASLTLDKTKLVMNGTSNGQRSINVNHWGNLITGNGSEITGNFYYYFYNYGYLNIQNSSISSAYSIDFYDTSDDSSVIKNSRIINNANYAVYTTYASPTISNNIIQNTGSYGIYLNQYSSPNITGNTLTGIGSYAIYAYY